MHRLPRLHLPHEFVHLLTMNLNASANLANRITTYILSQPDLKLLVQEKFAEFDNQKRISYIIQSLGWGNFRDRLAGLYLYHAEHVRFPNKTDSSRVKELHQFEKSIERYTVEGYSRPFLLGVYLKFCRLHFKRKDPMENYDELNISPVVISLLRNLKTKVIRIDYIMLAMNHYLEFFGEEALKELMEQTPFSYKTIYDAMNAGHRERLAENLLSYAYALGETDLFSNDLV